jgi:tRNA pseudouridine38-40 synthase
MKRYFLFFQYKGSNYHGWQIQPNARSVQEEMQKAMGILFKKDIELVGAGRTDTGVHARLMVAHFDYDEDLDKVELVYRLNSILSKDIAVLKVHKVKEAFHARFDAISRTYQYTVSLQKDPFSEDQAHRLFKTPDFELMNKACFFLLGEKDFSCFSKAHTQTFTNNCHIYSAGWFQKGDLWVFEIKANRFLRNMVRAIVGTMLEIGEGRRSVDSINELIAGKNRSEAGFSVPAKGLFLTQIEYPEEGFIE